MQSLLHHVLAIRVALAPILLLLLLLACSQTAQCCPQLVRCVLLQLCGVLPRMACSLS
jgi:hypothetical protein